MLQNLLEESVHIRDLKTIVESLAEHGAKIQDPGELTREVRVALAPAIVQGIFGPSADLSVAALDPALESLLMQSFGPGSNGALDPSVADFLATEAARSRKRWVCRPVCWGRTGSVRRWPPWCARLHLAFVCWHTLKSLIPTPSVSVN